MANPKEGKPIWIESVLSDDEYRECARKYPNTYNSPTKPPMFECEFKWRYRMGAGMNPQELKVYNKRIENLAKLLQEIKDKQAE